MRRLTALVIALAAIAFAAYAGPYFVVENEGLLLEPSLVAGWTFDAPFVDWTNLSISGDFYFVCDNLASYQTQSLTAGYSFGFAFANTDGRDVFEFGLAMEVTLDPTGWPNSLGLTTWETTIGFEGYPSDIVTLYADFDLTFGPGAVWNISPTFGLECYWP